MSSHLHPRRAPAQGGVTARLGPWSTLPRLGLALASPCAGLTTEPDVQFSHFQVCLRQNEKRMCNHGVMEPYDIRLCPHLEAMWERWDVLNETMSLDDVSSAWVLDSHHAAGEFVCPDCLQHEIGRVVFNAYAQHDPFVIGTDE